MSNSPEPSPPIGTARASGPVATTPGLRTSTTTRNGPVSDSSQIYSRRMNQRMPSILGLSTLLALFMNLAVPAHAGTTTQRDLKFETVTPDDRSPPAKVQLLYRPGVLAK